MAIALLTVGATFKAAAVPFHYWTPDAYQGAPTPMTGFLSVGPKLGRLRPARSASLPMAWRLSGADWVGVIAILAVLTMTVGNVVALAQTNVKRMLAYSSIAHTGYILAGLAAFAQPPPRVKQEGIEAILFYVLGYGVMNMAAFAWWACCSTTRRASAGCPLRRPCRPRSGHRRGHGGAAPLADRHPTHRRLLRQALRPARDGRRRTWPGWRWRSR